MALGPGSWRASSLEPERRRPGPPSGNSRRRPSPRRPMPPWRRTPTPSRSSRPWPRWRLRRARMEDTAGDWAQALADLDAALTDDPGSSEAHYLRARTRCWRAAASDDLAAAVESLNAALRSAPNWSGGAQTAGRRLFPAARFRRARPREFKIAWNADPESLPRRSTIYGRAALLAGAAQPAYLEVAANALGQLLHKGADYGAECSLGLAYFSRGLLAEGQTLAGQLPRAVSLKLSTGPASSKGHPRCSQAAPERGQLLSPKRRRANSRAGSSRHAEQDRRIALGRYRKDGRSAKTTLDPALACDDA